MTNKRYDTITTNFCGYAFQSVRVDDVDYYPIALLPKQDSANGIDGFPVTQSHTATDVERILGKGFPSRKIATSINSENVVCLSEETLIDLIDECAFTKKSIFCRTLLKASVGIQLRMSNDVTRGQEEKATYYVDLAAKKAEDIRSRGLFADLAKMQKELGFSINYGQLTLFVYQCTGLLDKYYAWREVYETNAARARNPFRGTLSQVQLTQLNNFELRAAERFS